MARKRLTQIFPFLIPFRRRQKVICSYLKMCLDSNKYATHTSVLYPYVVSNKVTVMVNENSGSDIKYQINKVDNLKLASEVLNRIVIYPGEVFSFWKLVKNCKKYGEFKDGLVMLNGEIVSGKGGGLCQMSNTLYQAFLKTPLEIVERHSHGIIHIPNPDPDFIEGVEATVMEGWEDLKVKNNTNEPFQIFIKFNGNNMTVEIRSRNKPTYSYRLINQNIKFLKEDEKIFKEYDLIRFKNEKGKESQELIYKERIQVTYPLDDNIELIEV